MQPTLPSKLLKGSDPIVAKLQEYIDAKYPRLGMFPRYVLLDSVDTVFTAIAPPYDQNKQNKLIRSNISLEKLLQGL